ncbi:nucleolar protein 9-like isoform X2 [Penaeus chinensis]|nr:nucleolar protein 9-like isoform X2 [Penaeus chinensis]
MQTLLALALKYSQENATQMRFEENEETNEVTEKDIPVTKEIKEEFISFLEKISKFVYNNLEDFIWDTYASHIICSIIMVCSAVDVQNTIKSKQKSQSNHCLFREEGKELKVPAVLNSVLPDIAERFTKLPDISGIVTYNCSSVVAQTLLLALSDTNKELCHAVVTHILDHGFSGISPDQCDQEEEDEGGTGSLPLLFKSNSATRLLEVLIMSSTSPQQKSVFDQYFKGHIKALVQSKHCNFAVQRILTCWKDKENFEDLFTEVSKTVEIAASTGYTGTIVSLAQACRQLSSNQWQCMEAVMEFLDCNQPDRHVQFVPLLVRMMKFDDFQKNKAEDTLPSTTLHGSLILQEFLQFNKPSKVVKSLLEMTTNNLQELACDMKGSHVISAYFASKFVGLKNHEKMIHKFKGTFTALACCKSGSRSLDDMWKVASIKMKTIICSELVEDEIKLKENTFGKFIFSNFMVSLFRKKDKSDWQELLNRKEKKRKMFDDLLKEADSDAPKKKKKKNEKSSVDTKAITEDDIFLDVEGGVVEEELLSE